MMTEIAVYTRLVAKPQRRDDLANALRPFLDNIANEPGTLGYALHLDASDDNAIWFYSVFSDQDALDTHRRNEAKLAGTYPEVGQLMSESVSPVEVHGVPVSTTISPGNEAALTERTRS